MDLSKENEVTQDNKWLAAICYFSVFFCGFIFPIIVYFVTQDPFTKKHSKKAFVSHLIPTIGVIVLIVLAIAGTFIAPATMSSGAAVATIGIGYLVLYGVLIIISIAVTIWNIVQGIKVLR